MVPGTPELERALVARVEARVAAAGRVVARTELERIVRRVLKELEAAEPTSGGAEPGSGAAEPAPVRASSELLVFVAEAERGETALKVLRAALERAASRIGARILAAHREPSPENTEPGA